MNIVNTRKFISMDFDSNEIRIVEGKSSKKGIVVNKYFTVKIPNYIYKDGIINDMEQLSFNIKNALQDNKISRGNVHAIVNSSIIILREVAFPKVDKEDIDNLIKYQLGDFVPIHTEDYVVKYVNLGTFIEQGTEKLNILIIGIPKNIVESHLELIKDLGLKPAVMDFKGNAISKLLSYGDTINGRICKNKTIGFVDLSFNSTSISLIKDELMQLSRMVEGGFDTLIDNLGHRFHVSNEEARDFILNIDDLMKDLSTDDKDYEKITEVKRNILNITDRLEMVIRYYNSREQDNFIDLLILHGDMAEIKGIEKLFTEIFNIPCIILDTIDKLKFEGDLSKYANAIGGLIRVNGVGK